VVSPCMDREDEAGADRACENYCAAAGTFPPSDRSFGGRGGEGLFYFHKQREFSSPLETWNVRGNLPDCGEVEI
jgi:hypothetical protein